MNRKYAEQKVDNIIAKLTSNDITRSDARTQIMKVDNIEMLNIDENTIDEVIYDHMPMRKNFLILFLVFVYIFIHIQCCQCC